MTTEKDFEHEEWELVRNAWVLCVFLNELSDLSISTFFHMGKDMVSAANSMQNIVKQKYCDNELLDSLVATVGENPHPPIENMPESDAMDTFQNDLRRDIQKAVALVDDRATQKEAMEYRELLYSTTQSAASATGKNFFGKGDAISPAEAGYLRELKELLGL